MKVQVNHLLKKDLEEFYKIIFFSFKRKYENFSNLQGFTRISVGTAEGVEKFYSC